MKKLLILGFALGSLAVFAQRYGGSTYYNYGTISMSDAVSPTLNRQKKENVKTVHYEYISGSTRNFIDDKSGRVCVEGLTRIGNKTTKEVNDFYLSYGIALCPKAKPLKIDILVGSRWFLAKGETPERYFAYNVPNKEDYIAENVEAVRCMDIETIKRYIEKSNKKLRRSDKYFRCPTDVIELNGTLINI